MSDIVNTGEAAAVEPTGNPSSSMTAEEQEAELAKWVERERFDYEAYNAEPGEAKGNTWDLNAQRYEWKEEYGDIGPRVAAIEAALFHNAERANDEILDWGTIYDIDVVQETETKINPIRSFDDAGLHPTMIENIGLAGYKKPTPIQAYTFPAIYQGRDIVACAQTGSGKTAAFLIPIISKLMGKASKLAAKRPLFKRREEFDPKEHGVTAEPLVLIVAPTRELVTQIHHETLRFCYRSKLLPCAIYGGISVGDQVKELRRGCDILISTPGRLCHLMEKSEVLTLSRVRYTVIDEADEMLSEGFQGELEKIMNHGDRNTDSDHVFMMFSATFPKAARDLAFQHMATDYCYVHFGRVGSTIAQITQNIIWANDEAKRTAVYDLILSYPPSRTMIFVNSKRMVDILDDYLYNLRLPTTSVHADRTQREREDALIAFRTGKCPILVTTGVTSRGIDVPNVMHVINYDLPSMEHGGITEYTHRIGRTGRIGNSGVASSLYNDRNADIAPILTKFLLENRQVVPEFLQEFVPAEGEPLVFDEEEGENANDGENANETTDGNAYVKPTGDFEENASFPAHTEVSAEFGTDHGADAW